MQQLVEIVMIVVVLTNLVIVGAARLGTCIRTVAMQGIFLSVLPIVLAGNHFNNWHIIFLFLVSMVLRGIVFPRLLFSALRDAQVNSEIEPLVGYVFSMIIGVCIVLVSIWLSRQLPVREMSLIVVPVAFATILTGLFIIVSRKLALNQVLGYIVMENGIYVLGLALVKNMPVLVEMGVLTDAFVAVFTMSIATFHISREFDHIEVQQLNTLKG